MDELGSRRPDSVWILESVTGGGLVREPLPPSLRSEGAAIRRALIAEFAAVPGLTVVETVDRRCLDDQTRPANVTRLVVGPEQPVDWPALVRSTAAVLLVAPESGGELATLARRVQQGGGRSLGATPPAIELCADKFSLAHFLGRIDVPTPPTRLWSTQDAWPAIHSPSGRVVVKPVDGAGALDTFVLDEADPQWPAARRHGHALLQPYRPGPACSASFLLGRDGRAYLVAVGRQRIVIDAGGEVRYEGGELPVSFADRDLAPVRRAVESIPGLFGFVGVDFVVVEPTGVVEVIEINPRVTTSIVGLTRLVRPGTIARTWLDLAADRADFEAADWHYPIEQGGTIGHARGREVGIRTPVPVPLGRLDPEFLAIRSAPPGRFRADGTILADQEA